VVERLHEFGDGGGIVPPVDIENVDIRRPELLERGIYSDAKGLGPISERVALDFVRSGGAKIFCVMDQFLLMSGYPQRSSRERMWLNLERDEGCSLYSIMLHVLLRRMD
jgi:hypothetical protein